MPDAGQDFYHDHCPQQAAGIAYRVLFSIVPLAIVLVSIFGLVLQDDAIRKDVLNAIVDFSLVVGAGLLVLLTALVTALGGIVERVATQHWGGEAGTLSHMAARIVTFALVLGVVLLLYRFVPARGIRFRDGLAGALVTTVLLQLISLASGFVYDKASSLSVIYGSLTVGLVFLYSVYLYSSALLLGAELAAAWARPEPVGPGLPVLTQIKRAVLGLFVTEKPID